MRDKGRNGPKPHPISSEAMNMIKYIRLRTPSALACKIQAII